MGENVVSSERAADRRSIAASCTANVATVGPASSVGQARESLRRRGVDRVVVIATDQNPLGVVPTTQLITAPSDQRVEVRSIPVVESGVYEETAAALAVREHADVLAVVDGDGHFVGLVPPQALLRVLSREHEQDVARFGGYLVRSAQARTALEERLLRRLWHRTPWLALGLLGAITSAVLTAGFEGELEQMVAVAFFVPAVVYLADAVGTQTEALVIRGISIGVPLRRVLWQEVATGGLIGVIMAIAFFPFAAMIGHSVLLGLAVGSSLVIGATTATVVALTLPYLFAHWGKDPAFGSGPLATVIQDLLTIAVYLGSVVLIVGLR